MAQQPLAVVGIACRFADVPNAGAFRRLVLEGRSVIRPLPAELETPFGTRHLLECPYPGGAAILGGGYAYVPGSTSLPAPENTGMEGDLYFTAQLVAEALSDAALVGQRNLRGTFHLGYAPPFNAATLHWLERTAFLDQVMDILRRYFGTAPSDSLNEVRSELTEGLPPLQNTVFDTAQPSVMASRIAEACGLTEGATVLDAGVLSGFATLQKAADDLTSGRADVAVAAAISPPLTRMFLEGMAGRVRFSEGNTLAPFSTDATGTLPGEGGVVLVLKRRADALKARHHIYALVKSCVTGGKNPFEYAAARAETPIETIQLVEADGRGECEADLAEVTRLQSLWGDHKAGGALVGIGSVKGNVGHCFQAASMAGLLKAILALDIRVLMPQVKVTAVPEMLGNLGSSVYLLDQARPWITGNAVSPRRAAVLADDFGGSRGAVILEEEPEDRV